MPLITTLKKAELFIIAEEIKQLKLILLLMIDTLVELVRHQERVLASTKHRVSNEPLRAIQFSILI